MLFYIYLYLNIVVSLHTNHDNCFLTLIVILLILLVTMFVTLKLTRCLVHGGAQIGSTIAITANVQKTGNESILVISDNQPDKMSHSQLRLDWVQITNQPCSINDNSM